MLTLMIQFKEWEYGHRPEITHVLEMLSEPLQDQPMGLIHDMTKIEAYNARIGVLLAEADSWLDRYTLIAMPSREAGRMESDRKAILDSETSPIRLMRDTLERLCDSIRQRLIMAESILSFHKQQYAERGSYAIHTTGSKSLGS